MISHPEKILFPDDGITKGEMAAYYELVAPIMLPHIKNRPVTMERFPSGIGKAGFMQKDVSRGFPAWLERVEVPKKGGVTNYPLIKDLQSLLWVANQNCITPHVWSSRVPELFYPDLVMFDLDPLQDDIEVLRAATLWVRDVLDELGLPSWVKTSGSKGFHIVSPLDGKSDYEAVSSFAFDVGRVLVQRHPEYLTLEFVKADRGGRILIDTGRNGYGATYAAPYAVRPKAGAPISAPCTWEEVESGAAQPQTWRLRDMAARVDAVGDLWAEVNGTDQSLTQATERLRESLANETDGEPTLGYHAMRRKALETGRNDRGVRFRPTPLPGQTGLSAGPGSGC